MRVAMNIAPYRRDQPGAGPRRRRRSQRPAPAPTATTAIATITPIGEPESPPEPLPAGRATSERSCERRAPAPPPDSPPSSEAVVVLAVLPVEPFALRTVVGLPVVLGVGLARLGRRRCRGHGRTPDDRRCGVGCGWRGTGGRRRSRRRIGRGWGAAHHRAERRERWLAPAVAPALDVAVVDDGVARSERRLRPARRRRQRRGSTPIPPGTGRAAAGSPAPKSWQTA